MQGRGIDCCNFIFNKIRGTRGIHIEAITAEAYADDLTLIFRMSDESVEIILGVLKNF
jgi:hypothetical protein